MEQDWVEPKPAAGTAEATAAAGGAGAAALGGPGAAAVDEGPEAAHGGPGAQHRLVRALALFTLLRVGLMAVITAVLMFWMPLIVALAFAVILQLPIAILAFPKPRRELTAALAERRAGHHAERDRLRAQLMGDDGTLEQ